MKSTLQPLLYTKAQTASLLAVSLRTIDNLLARKQLKAIRIGTSVRIAAKELDRFVKCDHQLAEAA